MDTNKYYEGIGKRKSATARVRIAPATRASIEVNDKQAGVYFPGEDLALIVHEPIVLSKLAEKLKVTVHVSGGGIHAQAEAVRLGLARAILIMDTSTRKVLKGGKLLLQSSQFMPHTPILHHIPF